MPELPEVETIKRGLQKRIIGLKIQDINILSPKSFVGNPNLAQGQKVLNIWRRAKYLGLDLENTTLLFHLKMTGQIIYEDSKRFIGGHPTNDMLGKMPNSHTRVIFIFDDKSKLFFNDQRRFGWIKIIENCKLKIENLLGKLGPEPLEKTFTWEILKQNLLKHRNMPIKVAIMDQTVVSGVGNIYSNEACFNAKLDPRRKVSSLSDNEFKKLYDGIKLALQTGIKYGGSTRAHFVNVGGERGYFLDYANVYGKEGYECNECSGKVTKIQLGGRGTYLCSSCQK